MPYADPEEKRKRDREYYLANWTKIREQAKRYYAANAEQIKTKTNAYYHENSEKISRRVRRNFVEFRQTLRTKLQQGDSDEEIRAWAGTRHPFWVESELDARR